MPVQYCLDIYITIKASLQGDSGSHLSNLLLEAGQSPGQLRLCSWDWKNSLDSPAFEMRWSVRNVVCICCVLVFLSYAGFTFQDWGLLNSGKIQSSEKNHPKWGNGNSDSNSWYYVQQEEEKICPGPTVSISLTDRYPSQMFFEKYFVIKPFSMQNSAPCWLKDQCYCWTMCLQNENVRKHLNTD